MLRIFLDINHWVNLRFCYENKVGYDKYRDISKILLTKAIHNELILVCSRF
jgi:hypothetical protein